MAKITEDYVSLEVAKMLKEKGFDEELQTYYEDNKINILCHGDWYNWNNSPMGQISAPTLAMAMKWLREVHDIKIMIRPYVDGTYSYEILNGFWYVNFDSYEDAVEEAIKYCLENLI